MESVYAAWIMGSPKIMAFDKKLEPMRAKSVQVLQDTKKEMDPKTGNEVLRFGKMRVKVDTTEYDCIEFKRFGSAEELEAWRAAKKAPPAAPQPPK